MRSATRQGGRQVRGELLGSGFRRSTQFMTFQWTPEMKHRNNIRNRLSELHETGNNLKLGDGFGADPEDFDEECQAWLVAVRSILSLLFGNTSHPYRSEIESICRQDNDLIDRVGYVNAILKQLISDLDSDLIFSIEDQTRAAVFDDFLEQAKDYLKSGNHRESGVFAGAVFEDTLRSLSRKCGVEEEGASTDKLISDLTNKGVLTAVKAKRARASAGTRNRAMHAHWNEIDLNDVNTLIYFTEELISILDET